MSALNLDTESAHIAERLRNSKTLLVACLCAEWCSTCCEYKSTFWNLANLHPEICFVWIDIETHADWLDEIVIENFPTILIEDKNISHFFGTVIPNITIIERMLVNLTVLPNLQHAPKLRNLLSI
ncbi:MAG: thioredoxin family protein [Burkholderia sp.]|nr:thioredoxin family protein [Burkholderia sp.]